MADFYYENTLTGVRFRDERPDLHIIPALHLKPIGEDGHEIKPKVTLPITPEKIKAAKENLKPSAAGVSRDNDQAKAEATADADAAVENSKEN